MICFKLYDLEYKVIENHFFILFTHIHKFYKNLSTKFLQSFKTKFKKSLFINT